MRVANIGEIIEWSNGDCDITHWNFEETRLDNDLPISFEALKEMAVNNGTYRKILSANDALTFLYDKVKRLENDIATMMRNS